MHFEPSSDFNADRSGLDKPEKIVFWCSVENLVECVSNERKSTAVGAM